MNEKYNTMYINWHSKAKHVELLREYKENQLEEYNLLA